MFDGRAGAMAVAHNKLIRRGGDHRKVARDDLPGDQMPIAFVESNQAATYIGECAPSLGVVS